MKLTTDRVPQDARHPPPQRRRRDNPATRRRERWTGGIESRGNVQKDKTPWPEGPERLSCYNSRLMSVAADATKNPCAGPRYES